MSSKRRRPEGEAREKAPRPKKRVRKQKEYHSSSEDSDGSDPGFAPVNLEDSEPNEVLPAFKQLKETKKRKTAPLATGANSSRLDSDSESEIDGSSDEDSGDDARQDETGFARRKKTKRNDPEAFSTSISRILSTKLSQSARKDPVLSRSREAVESSSSIANERLERKAKARLRADKREALERGRVKDVLGLTTGDAGETAEEEKRLRKIAQRGVVKLFNAVRAAQVRGEQAAREERQAGTIGMAKREEKATEMSKQGFLDLINGKKKNVIEEA